MNLNLMESIRAALGLSPDAPIEEIARISLPPLPVHQGAQAARKEDIHAIWADAEVEEMARLHDLVFYRASRYPLIFIMGPHSLLQPVPNTLNLEEGGAPITVWNLLPDRQDRVLPITTPQGNLVVASEPDEPEIIFFRIPMPPIDIRNLLHMHPGEPWIHDETERILSSADPFREHLALGMLARLWVPGSKESKQRLVQALLSGGQNPIVQALQEYAERIDASGKIQLTGEIQTRATALQSRLQNWSDDTFSMTSAQKMEHADHLRLLRDDLACLEEVLRTCGHDMQSLQAHLRTLDVEAESKLFLLSDAGSRNPRRLSAVHWIFPDAWWGI